VHTGGAGVGGMQFVHLQRWRCAEPSVRQDVVPAPAEAEDDRAASDRGAPDGADSSQHSPQDERHPQGAPEAALQSLRGRSLAPHPIIPFLWDSPTNDSFPQFS
jgi:hypothetical protein